MYYCIAGLDTLTWRDPCRFPESPSAPRKWTARYHIWNTSFIASEDADHDDEVGQDAEVGQDGEDGHDGEVGQDGEAGHNGGGDHDGEVGHDDDYLVRVPPRPEPRLASR